MSASFVSIPVRTNFFQTNQLAEFNDRFRVYRPSDLRTDPFAHPPRPLNLEAQAAFYNSRGGLLPESMSAAVDLWG